MDIRPIRNDQDHAAALDEIERLWGADPDSEAGERLEVLLTLVDAYEEAHHAVPQSDPIEAIVFMMEQRGLGEDDIAPLVGGVARLRDVLERRRRLTLPMIRRLSVALALPADILVREYQLNRAA